MHAALQVQYQQPQQAIYLLDALLELQPHCEQAKRLLAVACLKVGQYSRATMLCEALLQCVPQEYEPELWFCLSQARWKLNDQEGARQAHRCYLQSLGSQP